MSGRFSKTESDLEAFKKATYPLIGELKKAIGAPTVDKVLKAVGY
ncbi:MAG: hypothetical protein H6Q42_409 [Deltaproteobacteria bacterium]|nr:hypothetical protein [Deltaproteobacteria bacterium]